MNKILRLPFNRMKLAASAVGGRFGLPVLATLFLLPDLRSLLAMAAEETFQPVAMSDRLAWAAFMAVLVWSAFEASSAAAKGIRRLAVRARR